MKRGLVILLVWAMVHSAEAAVPEGVAPGVESAIDRGLNFIQRQQRADGSFDAEGPRNAVTGLCALAFLSAGHTPEAGRHGMVVKSACTYLAELNPEGGYFGAERQDSGRMYGHCIVTTALAAVHGTETDEKMRGRVRAALERAVAVICAAQDVAKNPDQAGGWRYHPDSKESDLSVTSACVSALHAARTAGIEVPQERLDRALRYVLSCYRGRERGFAYTSHDPATPSMTGAAMLDLALAGGAGRPEFAAAADFLAERPIRESSKYYYQSLYHTTLAAQQAGERTWNGVWKNNSRLLLSRQRREDGSWDARPQEPGGKSRAGRVYATAMACLTLSTPLRLIPVYQR